MKLGITLSAPLLLVACATLGLQSGGRSLFDGSSLDGWSRRAVHGGQGGLWSVENGVIVANQEPGNTGGLLGTNETFSDFEIELEFMADDPADTGLFLRTRESDGYGYQITLDVLSTGTVGSLYAPGAGNFLSQYPNWRNHFRPNDWNHVRARIVGQPARIDAWLNGVQTLAFQDTIARYPREGYVGLQVHGGAGSWGNDSRARFRNIRITELD